MAARGPGGSKPMLDADQAKKVIRLHDAEGLNWKTIGQRFGVSAMTVMNAYHRQKVAEGGPGKPETKKKPRNDQGLFC